MIYKAAPAWTFKGKAKVTAPSSSPSPHQYHPTTKTTLTKAPSWKMTQQIRNNTKQDKTPSPNAYNPSSSPKSNKMGIIGSQPRGKQNIQLSPGPSAYLVNPPKNSPSMSFAAKYDFVNKTIDFPGPGQYQTTNQRQKRGIILGRQNRFQVQYPDKKNRPGPGTYSFVRPNSATISFSQAPRMNQSFKKNTIGPGHYQIKSEFQRQDRGFTLNSKGKKSTPDLTPGPSNYSPNKYDLANPPSISMSKKYQEKSPDRSPSPSQYTPNYRYIACKTQNYSLGKAERAPLFSKVDMPGPGAYLSTQYSNTGIELSVGKSGKKEEVECVPGPGTYSPNKEVIQRRPKTAKIGTSKRFFKIHTESTQNIYNPKPPSRTPQFSFTRNRKLQHKSKEVPGPGSYKIESSICNLSSYAARK